MEHSAVLWRSQRMSYKNINRRKIFPKNKINLDIAIQSQNGEAQTNENVSINQINLNQENISL